MKKTYIAPSCEIVKLNAADIIATSLGSAKDKPGYGTPGGYGREGFWDDDEW